MRDMGEPKFTKWNWKVMEVLWRVPQASIRESQESFPGEGRQAYYDGADGGVSVEVKKAVGARGRGDFYMFRRRFSGAMRSGKLIDDCCAVWREFAAVMAL